MPRVTSTEQYRRHVVLSPIWTEHHKLYGVLRPRQQWQLHRFYQPAVTTLDRDVFEQRGHVAALAEPSLPQTAGKSFRKLERLYLLVLHLSQQTAVPIDICLTVVIGQVARQQFRVLNATTDGRAGRHLYVVGVARPEPDVDRLAHAVLALAYQLADEQKRKRLG